MRVPPLEAATVKSGGTLLTAVGQVQIREVRAVTPGDITDADARSAGHASAAALAAAPARWPEGTLYRIDFGALTADPRIALRARSTLTDEDRTSTLGRLDRLDAAAASGPWTRQTLAAIRDYEGLRAADLCVWSARTGCRSRSTSGS